MNIVNCLKSRRSWERYLGEVHRGLDAAGLDRDFFGFDDLKHMAESRVTAEQVVERAVRMARENTGARA